MSTLQIIKLQSGAFEHIDSIDGAFFLGRFNFKQEFNKAFLVEAYGAKRRQYSITEVEVFDFGGTAETFTNWTDLINRLVDLGYTGIDTNSIPSGGGVWGSITGNIASQTDLQNELNTKLDKVSTVDVEKVYIKNADGTQGMKPVSDLITSDRLVYFFQGGSSMPTINTWYGNNLGFAINGTTTFGNGASPTFPFTTIGAMVIPSGYIVEKIIFGEYFNPVSVSHDLEIYIARGEFTDNNLSNQLTNYDVIANETISIGYLTSTPKFFKNLTISNHSAKERSAIQIAMRQKTNNSQSAYSMTIILKKT